ncbi:unnamed protein product [Caenorhabditis auriculariae]|uniref:Uncharacterized protein n=1 Tax=Caenorhabditis auriculariae TaxID=2777116 RepID=A0A8S1GNF7_9PELO|nr:unnamed protein product [Caenorhabditis auriculariae]
MRARCGTVVLFNLATAEATAARSSGKAADRIGLVPGIVSPASQLVELRPPWIFEDVTLINEGGFLAIAVI